MKKAILSTVLLLGYFLINAQTFDVQLLAPKKPLSLSMLKFGDTYYFYELQMIDPPKNGVFTSLKRQIHNIRLKKLNAEMEEVNQSFLSGDSKKFGPYFPFLKIINNKLYLLYFKYIEKDRTELWTAVIDTASLQISGDKKIFDFEETETAFTQYFYSSNPNHPNRAVIKDGPSGYNRSPGSFFTEISDDGSKVLIAWTSGWSKNLYYAVLDKDMNMIRAKKEQLPEDKDLAITTTTITNDGTVFIPWYYYQKGKDHIQLLVNSPTGSEIKSFAISGCEALGFCMTLDIKRSKLIVAGPYKEEKNVFMQGMYIQSFNLDGTNSGPAVTTAFPEQLVTLFDNDKWGQSTGKKTGLSNKITFEAMLLEDGTLNLSGEYRDWDTRMDPAKPGGFTTSGTILNTRFDKGGKAVFTRIPKFRVSAADLTGDSYASFCYKNKVIYFYNDNLANLQADINEKIIRPKPGSPDFVLVAGIIEPDGSLTRKIIKDMTKENYLAIIESMYQIRSGFYLVSFQKYNALGMSTRNFQAILIEVNKTD